jgi:hypothetical protein
MKYELKHGINKVLQWLGYGLDRSQWPRGLRRGSAAARLLGSWFQIPPGAWMSVSCECCVLSGRGLCVGLITRPEESCRVWGVWAWSWSLDSEEILAHQGLLCHGRRWVRSSKNRGSLSARDRNLSLLHSVKTSSGTRHVSYSADSGDSLSTAVWPGRVDPSFDSNAEIKNVWSRTFISPYIFTTWCLIKHRDNSIGRSQWPCGIRRGFAAARLLGLWVRIPPGGGHGHLSLVNVMYCQVEVSASGWSIVQRSPTECGVSVCNGKVLITRRPWPTRGCCAIEEKTQSTEVS